MLGFNFVKTCSHCKIRHICLRIIVKNSEFSIILFIRVQCYPCFFESFVERIVGLITEQILWFCDVLIYIGVNVAYDLHFFSYDRTWCQRSERVPKYFDYNLQVVSTNWEIRDVTGQRYVGTPMCLNNFLTGLLGEFYIGLL